jgi:four helix bundle protein
VHWKELEVWKKAHSMVLDAYKLTGSFPDVEKFRLTAQLCRAVASVPANIVEGNARQSTKEYIQFLYVARGSLEEARYFALLAKELGYLKHVEYEEFESKSELVSRLLNGLMRSLKKKIVRQKVSFTP